MPRQIPPTCSCAYLHQNIEKHMEENHPENWSEYSLLSNNDAGNAVFQKGTKVPFPNNMPVHYAAASSRDLPFVFEIDLSMVDVMIGEMMYCNENA